MKAAAIILSLLCVTAHAQTAEQAVAADWSTTAIGLGLGAAEANPLGLLTIPLTLILLDHANNLPTGEREYSLSQISSVRTGMAVNNACIIAAIVTGGAFALVCPFLGVMVGMSRWDAGSQERAFWQICAHEKKSNPRLTCSYRAPDDATR